MNNSYQHYRKLYQSFDDDRLMKRWLRGQLSADSEAALKVELRRRGIDCAAETANLLELSDGTIEREINRGSVWKTLFRLSSISVIFFMISLVLQSHPRLGANTDIDTIIRGSLHCVLLGPALFVSQLNHNVGLVISVIFWTSLIVTALGSGDTRIQQWFYGLLASFIGLTLLNLLLTMGWDFIAAAIARN